MGGVHLDVLPTSQWTLKTPGLPPKGLMPYSLVRPAKKSSLLTPLASCLFLLVRSENAPTRLWKEAAITS